MLYLVNVATEETANLAVLDLNVKEKRRLVGVPLTLEAKIQSFSSKEMPAVVSLSVG